MNNLKSRLLPSVAIPTTAGTGAEVSVVAMVKDDKEGKKLLFGSPFLAMDQALLDPELIVSLPAHLTAATGMDAVTHCIEALVVEGTSSPITNCLALDALSRLFNNLLEAKLDGKNIEARSQTLVASTMAGMAFSSCGVGIVHALSHALGGQFGTHHGMTNAVLLPHGMRFNLAFAEKRYADAARYLKISQDKNDALAAQKLIDAVKNLIDKLGLPNNLRGLSVPKLDTDKLEQLVILASGDPAMIFNTRLATEKDIVQIYEESY
jgi:alcohol dehydrogenase class IV